jgi:hypothetical protein
MITTGELYRTFGDAEEAIRYLIDANAPMM